MEEQREIKSFPNSLTVCNKGDTRGTNESINIEVPPSQVIYHPYNDIPREYTLGVIPSPVMDQSQLAIGTMTGKRVREPQGDKKKAKHKKIEQKRRDGIKQKMDLLRSAVPNCSNETQAVVLEKTVEYLGVLKEQYSDLLSCAFSLESAYKSLGGTNDFLCRHSKSIGILENTQVEMRNTHVDTEVPRPVVTKDSLREPILNDMEGDTLNWKAVTPLKQRETESETKQNENYQ